MRAAIGMHSRPFVAGCDGPNSSVQHRVDKLCVWSRSDRPADDHAIEAIDHERQVHLAGWDLEFRDVGEPLLVWRGCAEVALQKVFQCRADLTHGKPSINHALHFGGLT